MDISGQWYVNVGDIPADFVTPVMLQDGGAQWSADRVDPYRERDGKLIIGDLAETHYVFDTSKPGSDFLSGVMKYPIPLGEDEDPEEVGGFFTDCAILLRHPGDMKITTSS